jgi:hypothetical protein
MFQKSSETRERTGPLPTGRLPNQQGGQIFNRTMISPYRTGIFANRTAKSLTGPMLASISTSV